MKRTSFQSGGKRGRLIRQKESLTTSDTQKKVKTGSLPQHALLKKERMNTKICRLPSGNGVGKGDAGWKAQDRMPAPLHSQLPEERKLQTRGKAATEQSH